MDPDVLSAALLAVVTPLAEARREGSTEGLTAADLPLERPKNRDHGDWASNAAMKLALLTYAFEALECLGVEFRVHHLNTTSRRAVERLGAQQDGILRAHRIMPDGTLRHTVVYSILAWEWSGVKASLEHRLRG